MGVIVVVVGWMFGRVGCYVTSKDVELSYKLGYLLTVALLIPVFPVCPDFQGLYLPISEVYLHHRHYDLTSF